MLKIKKIKMVEPFHVKKTKMKGCVTLKQIRVNIFIHRILNNMSYLVTDDDKKIKKINRYTNKYVVEKILKKLENYNSYEIFDIYKNYLYKWKKPWKWVEIDNNHYNILKNIIYEINKNKNIYIPNIRMSMDVEKIKYKATCTTVLAGLIIRDALDKDLIVRSDDPSTWENSSKGYDHKIYYI